MEEFKNTPDVFENGQVVYSPEHGEVRIKGQGREPGSYIVVNKDNQEFEVYESTLITLEHKSEDEEEEEEQEEEEELE